MSLVRTEPVTDQRATVVAWQVGIRLVRRPIEDARPRMGGDQRLYLRGERRVAHARLPEEGVAIDRVAFESLVKQRIESLPAVRIHWPLPQ